MGWSSPQKTGITTTRRITAPPSTMVPGGTATATPLTLTASTSVVSTPPMPMASSGPPGLAGSTHSSSLRWRYGPPVTLKINETDKSGRKKEDIFETLQTRQLGGITCLDIVYSLNHNSLSLVDYCLPPDVSLPSCSSSSITQLLVMPAAIILPLVPFFK